MNSIWSILGLTATRDIGDIKRAYAAKLKAIDIDADPAAYQELRGARDAAIALARQAEFQDRIAASEPVDDPDALDAQSPDPAPEEQPAEELSPEIQAMRDAHQALSQILFQFEGDHFFAATPEEEEAMKRHFAQIAEGLADQDVSMMANAAHWFADAIARMIPRSNCLVDPAAALFGWNASDEMGQDPMVAHVMRHKSNMAYVRELENPSHPLHPAWLELRTPANENSSRGIVSKKKVRQLLEQVRTNHPDVEDAFDWYRVHLWDQAPQASPRWNFGFVLAAIIALNVIRIAAGSGPSQPQQDLASEFSAPAPPSGPQPMHSPAVDIPVVLSSVGATDISLDRLEDSNKPLHSMMMTNWQQSREAGKSMDRYISDANDLLSKQLAGAWSYASPSLLVERLTIKRDITRSLGRTSADACVHYLDGGEPQLYESQRKRLRAMQSRLLLSVDATRPPLADPPDSFGFVLPAAIAKTARSASGLSEQRFAKALNSEGTPIDRCNAVIALYDTLLDLPEKQAAPIIRDMFSD